MFVPTNLFHLTDYKFPSHFVLYMNLQRCEKIQFVFLNDASQIALGALTSDWHTRTSWGYDFGRFVKGFARLPFNPRADKSYDHRTKRTVWDFSTRAFS